MDEIQIKVVAFGIARDIIGGSRLELNLPTGATASQAMKVLNKQFPDFQQLTSLNLAINEAYVDNDHPIQDQDELVLIPPVSGG